MTSDSSTTTHKRQGSLLWNRNFVLLWCAYAISAMGDHLSEMAILKTQDALNPSVDITPLNARMSFAFFVPFFLLSPLAGVLADRLPRRFLMIFADAARCGLMMGFAAMIAWSRHLGDWGPFLPLVTIGTFAALFSPARSALLPTLIKPGQLVRANGMISGLGIIATMVAALVGGYLADHYEPTIAFRADAATFVLSGMLLFMIRPPRQPVAANSQDGTPRAVGGLMEGCRYVLSHRRVAELLAIATIVWFCGSLVNSVIPAVVRDSYGGTFTTISAYRGYLGLGFLVGAIIISLLGPALRSEIAMTWGLLGLALAMTLFASSIFVPMGMGLRRGVGAVGVTFGGVFAVATMASFNTLLQRIVANRFRGRVFGLKDQACTGALLVAMGSLGMFSWFRVDRWVGHILLVVAAVTAVAGAIALVVRFRRGSHGVVLNAAENMNEFLAKFWWRLERVGRSTVPREGAVIITANHTCSIDPNMLLAAVPYRKLSFMIAAEYTTSRFVRIFSEMLDCIPVKRNGEDIAAMKNTLRHLRAGKAVGIFIEGRIIHPGEVPTPKEGVAMLALKTGVPVIPAYISGMTCCEGIVADAISRHHARVRFGLPVDLDSFRGKKADREVLGLATAKIYSAIQALAPRESDQESTTATPIDPGGR